MTSTQSLDGERLKDEKRTPEVISLKPTDVADDGGYGWVIVGSTCTAFSLVGFHWFTFGIFAPEFASTYALSESDIGLIASLRFGLFSLSEVLAGPLVQIFGCRPVAISSVLLCTVGYVATAFATNRVSITISFGLIPGLGTGLLYIPSVVIVQQYFTRRRAIAAAISSVGLGVSSLVCSPLARILVDTFGWRGAALLFAGFSLQMLVSTALYRPPNQGKQISDSGDEEKTQEKTSSGRLKVCAGFIFKKKLFSRYYVLFTVTNTTLAAVVDIYYLRMALIGRSFGIEPLKAAVLPSLIAALVTTTRGVSGFLAKWVPPHVIYGAFNVLSALVVFVVPLLPTMFLAHAICCTVFGSCLGIVFGIQHTYLVTLVGVHLLPLALSWGSLFSVIFEISNNLFVGWLLDETGSYRIPVWYAAAVHFLGSLSALAIIFIKYREKKDAMLCKEEQF